MTIELSCNEYAADNTSLKDMDASVLCSGVQSREEAESIMTCFHNSTLNKGIKKVNHAKVYPEITDYCRSRSSGMNKDLDKLKTKLLKMVDKTGYRREHFQAAISDL